MSQGVVIRSLILLLLLHQTSTGVWYYFDDDGDDVEFKLDEVDSTYDSDYPNGDLEDKMDSHELGVTFCLWLTLFVLIVVGFNHTSQIHNARWACLAIATIAFGNGLTFGNFATVLEDETSYFSYNTSNSRLEDDVYFWDSYYDYNTGNDYEWGPGLAWYFSIFIIPVYALYLASHVGNLASFGGSATKSKSVKQAKSEAKQKVANKIIKNMGDKGRYDSTNQLRTLVVMQVLGNTRSFFSAQKVLQDTPNFFQSTTVPDSVISDNTAAAYYMIGGSDVAHGALVNSQYK